LETLKLLLFYLLEVKGLNLMKDEITLGMRGKNPLLSLHFKNVFFFKKNILKNIFFIFNISTS